MTCDRLGVQLPPEGLHFEGAVYNLEWQVLRQTSGPYTQSLPASDYAVYLINATKFHCGQIFHLFDEEDFMHHFATFHQDKNGIDRVSQLWYTHYLLVLAFGKAFVARNAHDGRPPGANFFLEAMRHLPEIILFSTTSIESIEILICAALYLQCLDFRSAAYNLVRPPTGRSAPATDYVTDWASFEKSSRTGNAYSDVVSGSQRGFGPEKSKSLVDCVHAR